MNDDAPVNDRPIETVEQLATLRRVVAQFCFDVECPICGMVLCEGERHECRLVTLTPALSQSERELDELSRKI